MPSKFSWTKLSRPKASEDRFEDNRSAALPVLLTPEDSTSYPPYRSSESYPGPYNPSYHESQEYNQDTTYHAGEREQNHRRTLELDESYSPRRPDSQQSSPAISETKKSSRNKLWRNPGRSREDLAEKQEESSSRFHIGRKTSIRRKDPAQNRSDRPQVVTSPGNSEQVSRFYSGQTVEGEPQLPSVEEPRNSIEAYTYQGVPSADILHSGASQNTRLMTQTTEIRAHPELQRTQQGKPGLGVQIYSPQTEISPLVGRSQESSQLVPTGTTEHSEEKASQQQYMDSNRYSAVSAPNRDSSRLQAYQRNDEHASSPTSSTGNVLSSAGILRSSGTTSINDRATPPLARTAGGSVEAEALQKELKELKEKYNKVKRLYFEKNDQVTALQDTLAHQRLAVSRTALDDSEYVARLTRLDGLVKEFAFLVRKNWETLPEWLQPAISKTAMAVGKQEMIAVGRAFVSRWLAEEILNKHFHPGLDFTLSEQLRKIHANIRGSSALPQSSEEEEALNAKIVNWRLTTIDGLKPMLSSPDASTQRQRFTTSLVHELATSINSHMREPVAGIEQSISVIVELAVGILANLPLESRDVEIEYYPPGCTIFPTLMTVEPGAGGGSTTSHEMDADRASLASGGGDLMESPLEQHGGELGEQQPPKTSPGQIRKSFLGSMMGSKKSVSGAGSKTHSAGGAATPVKEEVPKVRLCLFLAAQIRGKTVLCKAPVLST